MRKRRLQALCGIFVLVVPVVAGTPAALAVDEPTPTATATATPSPEAESPLPAEPSPTASPVPTAAPSPEPAPSAAPQVEAPPTSTSSAPDPTPNGDAPAGAATPDAEPPPEKPPAVPEVLAVAQNVSTVFQAIWQVQHGCQSHCYGTSQSQSSTQLASTAQGASADANGGPGAAAETAQAVNHSVTYQFSWQVQFGCLAFCYATTQTQSALQSAQTIQVAEAVGDLAALVGNFAETLQVVWQLQEGCRQECYGTSQSQSVTQGQDTTQVSMAASGVEPPVPAVPQVQIGVLPAWLIALATNVGATIQTIVQVQEATCERNCTGDAQVQVADQVAAVVQVAVAIAGRPPVDGPPVAPTSGDEPVDVLPPVAQPAPEQLVGSDQPPAQTGAPDEATPTAHGPSGRQPAWRPAHTGERSPQAAAPGRSRPALPPRQTVRAPAGDRASAHAEDESQRLGGLLGVVARASDSAQVPSVAQSLTTTDGLAHRVIAIVLTATLVVGFLVVLAAREWNRSVFPNK